MHQANNLIKNQMAPVTMKAPDCESTPTNEDDSLSHGETDDSFESYVERMEGSATFDEDGVLPEEVVEVLEKPEIAAHAEPVGAHIREEHWSSKRSFLAETPYFNAYVEKEMYELDIVTSILNDVSDRTKTFAKHGSMMADATHRLSLACRLRKEEASQEEQKLSGKQMDIEMERRRHALGPEITDLLGVLGETLEEVASAQLNMCKVFDETLSKALESFAQADMRGVKMLKTEADSSTEAAEQTFYKYITGKQSLAVPADEKTESDPPASKNAFAKFWGREKNSPSSAGPGDPTLDKAIAAANWRVNLEEVRLNQTTAELKRFQFTKLLLDVKNRRNVELSEGAVNSAHAMQAYFNTCMGTLQNSLSVMTEIEEKQKEKRKAHQKIEMPIWLERMNLIVKVLSTYQHSAVEAAQDADKVEHGDPMLIDKQIGKDLDTIESDVGIWEVPSILAKSSRYRREAPAGVLHEGWLYQKTVSRLGLSQWNRRWFMLKKDGIYCLESSAELKKEKTGHSTTKFKICDVVLCTIREIPDDPTGRFRFELIAPRQKPMLLMARGPHEMKIWVDKIRTAVEKQLTHGNPDCQKLNQNIGKLKKDRRSTEIAMTVFKKKSPLVADTASIEEEMSQSESGHDDYYEDDTKRSPLVIEVLAKNATCADCGMAAPDWVSLNLGILVCLQCSGVHRSLGVHVSKVRSLNLDSLSDGEARLFSALGNSNANRIWEETAKKDEKPNQLDDRNARESWIRRKYLQKEFLAKDAKFSGDEDKTNNQLYEAAKEGDLMAVAEALAHGADVDWTNDNEDGRTPLHACAISPRPEDETAEWRGIECAELLIQNGARMDILDRSDHGVLDCAVIRNGDREMVEYLSQKLA